MVAPAKGWRSIEDGDAYRRHGLCPVRLRRARHVPLLRAAHASLRDRTCSRKAESDRPRMPVIITASIRMRSTAPGRNSTNRSELLVLPLGLRGTEPV